MSIFKRIGTQKKKFKLQFFIGRLKFSTFYPGKVYIVAKRGNHKVKSELKLQMTEDCKLNFNKEILQLEVTLFFDEKENKYQQKLGQINVVMIDPKGSKMLLGVVPFDVGQYANLGNESMKEKKQIEQTPKYFEALIQYNVFIKYIGQGSESSLDKVADFFFGKKQSESQKKIANKNEISTKKYIQDDSKKGKDLSRTQYKKGTNLDFYETDEPVQQKSKNFVTAGKGAKRGSREFVEDNEELARNFYFDDTQNDVSEEKSHKKNKHKSNSLENKNRKGKKDESNEDFVDRQSGRENDRRQSKKFKKQKNGKQFQYQYTAQSDKKIGLVSQQTVQTMNSTPSADYLQIQKELQEQRLVAKIYQQKHEESQNEVEQLKKFLTQIKAQNHSLQEQLSECKQQITRKDQLLQEEKAFRRQRQPQGDEEVREKFQFYQQQLKRVQKEKNQFIVQNSKLKQKYKIDFNKYSQLLNEKQSHQQSKTDSTKADYHKLKQQCSQYRETIDKLTKEKNDKSSQLSKQKSQNKIIQEELTQVKTNLSKIKLKICNKLNQSLVKDQIAIVDLLMDLNKDQQS